MTEKIDVDIVDSGNGYFDIAIGDDGDLLSTSGFNTTIKNSLAEERRASGDIVTDVLKRRGYIGNESSDDPNYERGSLLWMLEQSRANTATKNSAVNFAKQSLQHLVDDGYLSKIDVSGFIRTEGIELEILLTRKDDRIEKIFYKLWENTGF